MKSFEIIPTPTFARELKRLARKYPSLKEDIGELRAELLRNPETGTPLGHQCFKLRLAIRSKGKGKSGGARVITMIVYKSARIYLLSIYDKSEFASISDREIRQLIVTLSE